MVETNNNNNCDLLNGQMQIEWNFDWVSICEIESHRALHIRVNVAPSDKSHECLLRFCRALTVVGCIEMHLR